MVSPAMVGITGGQARARLTHHQHTVADGRGEFFNTLKQFRMSFNWRCLKLLSGPPQILAHEAQCPFDTLVITGPPMRPFARGLKIANLNNLSHLPLHYCVLNVRSASSFDPGSSEFLAGETFSRQGFVSALAKPQNLAGNSVHNVEFTWSQTGTPQNRAKRKHDVVGIIFR
jgi:hypothetical protein